MTKSPLSKLLLAGACALAVSHAVQAEEQWPRWYLGLGAGVSFIENTDLNGVVNGDLDTDGVGFAGTAALGYLPFFNTPFFDNFRTEAEFGLRQIGLDSYTNAGTRFPANDSLRVFSYMGNVYYDFHNSSQWTPYIGAGFGGANVRLNKGSGLGNTTDSDNVLAYQFMAGLSYAPESIPMTEWGLGYRYFIANSPEYRTTGANLKLDDVTSHNVEANARFRF